MRRVEESPATGPAANGGPRREELLRAAGRAIGRHGITAVRLTDVAAEAGVSIGTLQHYFDSRDAMVTVAVEAVARTTVEHAREAAAAAGSPWEVLIRLVGTLAPAPEPRLGAATWLELCAVASREPALRPAVRTVQDEWRRIVRRLIARGCEDGSFQLLLPVEDTIDAIVGLGDGTMVAAAAEQQDLTITDIERRTLLVAEILLGVRGDPTRAAT